MLRTMPKELFCIL